MRKLLSLFLCLLITTIAGAEPQAITLKEYLQEISKNDPAYQAIFHEKSTAEGLVKSLHAMYDTRVFAGYSYGEQAEAKFGSFNTKDGKRTNWSLGGAKKFKPTGTELSGTFLRADTSTTYETIPQDTEVVNNKPAVTWRITQPLWRDWLGILSRMPIERMEIQKEVAVISEQENEEAYYEEAIKLYYDWLSLTLSLEPLKESLNNAELLLKQVERQYKNDVALKTDLLRSQEAVLIYQNSLEEILYNWNMVGSELYKKMNKVFVPAQSWDDLSQMPEVRTDFYVSKEVLVLKDIRPLASLDKMVKQIKMEIAEHKRKELPKLSVYGEVADYKNEDSQTDSFSALNSRDTVVGFDFSMSLDKSDTQGYLQQLKESISKAEENLADTKKSLQNLLNNYLLKVKSWKKLKENAQKIADYSEERLKLETKRYQSGKSMLRDVADYRNQYAQNKTNYLNKMIELAKLEVQVASLNDELLNKVKEEIK